MNTTVWLGIAAALALVVAAEVAAPPPDAATAPLPAARETAVVPGHPAATLAAEQMPRWVATALGRPLFNPDRRPMRRPGGGAALVSDAKAVLPRLAGIIVDPQGGLAIFAPAAAGEKPLAVPKGGRLSAWTVVDIAPREVRVSGPGGESTLHVAFEADGAGALPAAGAVLLPGLRNRPINPHPLQQRHGNEAE